MCHITFSTSKVKKNSSMFKKKKAAFLYSMNVFPPTCQLIKKCMKSWRKKSQKPFKTVKNRQAEFVVTCCHKEELHSFSQEVQFWMLLRFLRCRQEKEEHCRVLKKYPGNDYADNVTLQLWPKQDILVQTQSASEIKLV